MAETITPATRQFYEALAATLAKTFKNARISLTDEVAAQAEIGGLLDLLSIRHEREYRLGLRERLDFWLPEAESDTGALIEVKMNAARPAEIIRQLGRYAAYPRVQALFLVSNRAMFLPVDIGGKPAYLISLGRAWL